MVLEKYSVSLLARHAVMSATGAILFYSLIVRSAKPELLITLPLIFFGIFRYWFAVEATDGGRSPKDGMPTAWQLLSTVVLWVAARN